MTPKQLRKSLDDLGFTQKRFGELMGRTESTVSLWCNGKQEIPEYVQSYLDMALQIQGAKTALSFGV